VETLLGSRIVILRGIDIGSIRIKTGKILAVKVSNLGRLNRGRLLCGCRGACIGVDVERGKESIPRARCVEGMFGVYEFLVMGVDKEGK